MKNSNDIDHSSEIAVIGMACRFPGAATVDEFWSNVRNGVEAISFFSNEELISAGLDPDLVHDRHYVKAGGVLPDTDMFDASFFSFTPREAEIMDPQHRIFLECAWTALEHAGYCTDRYPGRIGVYAGVGMNTYLSSSLSTDPASSADLFQIAIANEKDHLATRTSYKLNLKGPSVTVSTACSTSLVAIHLACQSLLNGECDMFLAGGVSIRFPQKSGYLYQAEGIASPDGHCRAFDARAQGTVPGSGVGVVVLTRMTDAIKNGDFIHAVIKGSAINNDGSLKIGYTAPGTQGQAEVIAEAQAVAGVAPETITYIETHGTGTPLGDPIEVAALTKVFRTKTQKKGFCAIGSTKTMLGHLDAAAGVASFIKTVLALKHCLLPPSLHFEQPNPQIDFANSPFYVNTTPILWEIGSGPRRAGVSAFGLGGTNAHIILEEAPARAAGTQGSSWQLLLLSARTDTALDAATSNLVAHLKDHPTLNLADVAYTCQVGRKAFQQRQALLCKTLDDAVQALETQDPVRILRNTLEGTDPSIFFLFPGVGDHYLQMAWELYQAESTFRAQIDRCCEKLKPLLGLDLRDILYADDWRSLEKGSDPRQQLHSSLQGLDMRQMLHRQKPSSNAPAHPLEETWLAQPAVFVIEYALARLWIEWSGSPRAMLGYSLGEYVAACVAGVISLEDALFLVAKRAQMIHTLPPGAMLAIPLPEKEVRALLNEHLSLAAANTPSLCVVSGPQKIVVALEQDLVARGVACRRLQTLHAFHSTMMNTIANSLIDLFASVKLAPPKIPYLSNVTGTWITPEQATDPHYWAKHLCQTVRFADGVSEILQTPHAILLEVGPGQTLSTLAMQNRAPGSSAMHLFLPSLRYSFDRQSDVPFLLQTLARLWLAGAHIHWQKFYSREHRQHVPLPTYPFERQRYWIESHTGHAPALQRSTSKRSTIADWFYLPSWKRTLPYAPVMPTSLPDQQQRWLIFLDEIGIGTQLAAWLESAGQNVTTVAQGNIFRRSGENSYVLPPQDRSAYDALLKDLRTRTRLPTRIVHCWSITASLPQTPITIECVKEAQHSSFYSLLFLAQALGKHIVTDTLQLRVLSNYVQPVESGDLLDPGKATVLGPCKIIPQEYTNIPCQHIDIACPQMGSEAMQHLFAQIMAELDAPLSDPVVAYRGRYRWTQIYEPLPLTNAPGQTGRLRKNGVYMITGGLGMLGFTLAKWLVESMQARLVLIGRSELPPQDAWQRWTNSHDQDDTISTRIKRIQELEQLGAEVVVIRANVADKRQMEAAVNQAIERFGQIHGVIHAAGIVEETSFLSIQEMDQENCEVHFQSKIYGTLVLEEVLCGRAIDFCLLYSSLSSVLGGLQFTAYASANMFLDAYAHSHNALHRVPWLSVDWDGSATLRETVAAMQYVLSSPTVEHVVVSTADLYTKLRQWIAPAPPEEAATGQEQELSLTKAHHPRPTLHTIYVAPRDPIEEGIAAIWQNMIGIDQVGVHDDFFALGGHSLLATQIVTRLRKAFLVELPLRAFLERPTVAELATAIAQLQAEQATSNEGTVPIPPLIPVSRTQDLPLSFAQQRLWFLDQLKPGNSAYNISMVIELHGLLHVETLQHCLDTIVQRHEILRTTISVNNSQPVQIIGPASPVPLPLIDLRDLPPLQRTAETQRHEQDEAQKSFDLAHDTLLRTILLWLEQDRYLLLLTFHHIVSDDWSIHVFFQEIAALYNAPFVAQQQRRPLPELSIQYADFAAWQRQWMRDKTLQAQLTYWRQQLAGAPLFLELPTDYARPPVQTVRGARHTFTFSASVIASLKALSQREGATLFMTLLAAFKLLLSFSTGQDDIVVGSPVANRTRMETEHLIGCFVNTLVLRTRLSGDLSFLEFLGRVRETAIGAFSHQDAPFEALVQDLGLERDMSRNPLFQVMFSLHTAPMPSLKLANVHLKQIEGSHTTVRLDLTLHIGEVDQQLLGSIVYNADLFKATTIQGFARRLEILLQTLVTHYDATVDTLMQILARTDEAQQATEEERHKEAVRQKLRDTRRKGRKKSAAIGEEI